MLPAPSHCKLRLVCILAFLLAFQAAGWYSFWGVLVMDAKISARQAYVSPQATLQHLTFAAADLNRLWVDKKEIRLDGRLYDVVRQRAHGDSIYLEVYHDRQEEALFHILHNLVSGQQSAKTPLRSWLLHWAGGVYLLPRLPGLPQRPAMEPTAAHFSCRLLPDQYRPVQPGPPPKG